MFSELLLSVMGWLEVKHQERATIQVVQVDRNGEFVNFTADSDMIKDGCDRCLYYLLYRVSAVAEAHKVRMIRI